MADPEAALVPWIAVGVHGHVFDDAHVLQPFAGAQPGLTIMEKHVENPAGRFSAPRRSQTPATKAVASSCRENR